MNNRLPDKGDPSDILQFFPQFNLQLLCCRYWWLKNWEFDELSYPYWRIYWNPYPGAKVIYDYREIQLDADKLIVISPNTSYATRLFDHEIPQNGFLLKGGRIDSENSQERIMARGNIPHLFIHFNIGIPYDNISPQVFSMPMNEIRSNKISSIINSVLSEHRRFDFHTSLVIRSLIMDLLVALPGKKWEVISRDSRIMNVLNYIDLNIKEDLSNSVLAAESSLAKNAFNRLFKTEVGIPPQVFIRKKRIDKACVLLDHTQDSIDLIAEQTGFADRYHFSKIFKQLTGISPGKYRKEFNV